MRIDEFDQDVDPYFIKNHLVPYLSSVYYAIVARGNKDYISIRKLKHYMNLPEVLNVIFAKQINANGDERIDHDEFVAFFLKLLMGSES